jgi:hypothetical protein
MTAPAPTITPGDHIHGVEVLSLDPLGKKRVCVACPCGSTHLVGVEALIAGSVECPARPVSGKMRTADRRGHHLQRRQPVHGGGASQFQHLEDTPGQQADRA